MNYTVRLEEDLETGDLILPIPDDVLNQMGWDIGDTLLWEELPNGTISVKKEEHENGE